MNHSNQKTATTKQILPVNKWEENKQINTSDNHHYDDDKDDKNVKLKKNMEKKK